MGIMSEFLRRTNNFGDECGSVAQRQSPCLLNRNAGFRYSPGPPFFDVLRDAQGVRPDC